ncbi:murein biosynthesis integral membrane protein MurJ [Exiguobacterium sp. TRN 1102]|uniref:murein biosynthesis integral membrane protein MurJ n=1 Tax=Exiguobacterium sp. TRN 1102 TaxID=3420732 RepID=UPI003D7873F4
MNKIAVLVMSLILISKILGFTRDLLLSFFYGASVISDAYLISQTIPMVIFSFVGIGIATAFIPVYIKIENESGTLDADKYTSNLVNIIFLFSSLVIGVSLIFVEQIVSIFATGFEGEAYKLTVEFTRVSIWSIYGITLSYLFQAYLQVKGSYYAAAAMGLPLNIITISSIIISTYTQSIYLAIGGVIASFSQVFVQLFLIKKSKFKYRITLDVFDTNIKKILIVALPLILGASIDQINILVDRTLATSIALGGVSALNYSNKLILFFHGIIVMSLVSVLYPTISRMVSENKIDELKKEVSNTINVMMLFLIPASMICFFFSKDIIDILFNRGAFDETAFKLTSEALSFYSIGMFAIGAREVFSKIFYSMEDTKTPMINASVALTVNIFLNIILSRYMGLNGLALATSLSAILSSLLMYRSLKNKIGKINGNLILFNFSKILFATIVSILMMMITINQLENIMHRNFSFIFTLIIGSTLYFAILKIVRNKEVDMMIRFLKNKFFAYVN